MLVSHRILISEPVHWSFNNENWRNNISTLPSSLPLSSFLPVFLLSFFFLLPSFCPCLPLLLSILCLSSSLSTLPLFLFLFYTFFYKMDWVQSFTVYSKELLVDYSTTRIKTLSTVIRGQSFDLLCFNIVSIPTTQR